MSDKPIGGSTNKRVSWMTCWVALAATLLMALACGGAGGTSTMEPKEQVRGHVLDVVSSEANQVETVRVRDDAGKDWTFIVQGDIGMNASHLRLHQALGETALISYVTEGDRLVVVDIGD